MSGAALATGTPVPVGERSHRAGRVVLVVVEVLALTGTASTALWTGNVQVLPLVPILGAVVLLVVRAPWSVPRSAAPATV